jgi:hypothetical protein
MDFEHPQQQQQRSQQVVTPSRSSTRQRTHSASASSSQQSSRLYVTPTRKSPSSLPVTPTDEVSPYTAAHPLTTSQQQQPSSQPLRSQRSGSFLKMAWEQGKGMVSRGGQQPISSKHSHSHSRSNVEIVGQEQSIDLLHH